MRIDPAGDHKMAEKARDYTARQPWRALLTAVMELGKGEAELLNHSESSWASITFSGMRHRISLGFTGLDGIAAAETLIEALPEHEFTLPRHVVIQATVAKVDQCSLPEPRMTIEVEVLLLDNC